MKRVFLGKTGIETSCLGIGTSAAYDGAVCPAKLRADDYPDLLVFAFEQGVTLWDTSHTYGTHGAVREAFKEVPRDKVTICTKTTETGPSGARTDVEKALRELGTDFIDIFMLQCVRNKFDYRFRSGALETLGRMKEEGHIRAVGLASHGLGALEACLESEGIDIVLGRVNYSGHLMDSRQDDFKSVLAGMPSVKRLAKTLLPQRLFSAAAGSVQKTVASEADRKTALRLFAELRGTGKSIIGMKILGEGNLAHDVKGAVSYATSLPFLDAFVAGCCSREELTGVISAMEGGG